MLKLAVFDLDGTLKVEPDPYVYLHRRLGVMAEAEAITAAGLSGQLAYEEWLRADAELWRGTPRARLLELFAEDAYIPGAPEAVRALRAHGAEIAILSSGLRLHAEMVVRFARALGIRADELLGLTSDVSEGTATKPDLKIMRRLNRIASLPPKEQKIMLKAIDGWLQASQRKAE